MNLSSLLSFGSSRGQRRSASQNQPCRFRPSLESLEERRVNTVGYYGGGVMPHVEVQGVYLGQDWNSGTALNEAQRSEGYLKSIVNSSYMDMLSGAGYGVYRGTWDAGRILNYNLNKGQYLTDTQIEGALQAQISSGTLKAPDANRLYVVYVEPGVAVYDNNHPAANPTSTPGYSRSPGFLGYHSAFLGHNQSNQYAYIYYAVIPHPGGYNYTSASGNFRTDFDQMTSVVSHELTEAVTDPNESIYNSATRQYYLGWFDKNYNQEISDLAVGHVVSLNGYCVQDAVNKADQLIRPAGWQTYLGYYGYSASATGGSAGRNDATSTQHVDAALESVVNHLHVSTQPLMGVTGPAHDPSHVNAAKSPTSRLEDIVFNEKIDWRTKLELQLGNEVRPLAARLKG